MIDRIKGKIVHKEPTLVVIDIGGVALAAAVPLTVSERLGAVGSDAQLITYLHVREDAILLFGFNSRDERELFTRLLSVSGIGPKMALGIMSRFSPAELGSVVAAGDSRRLTAVKGIGPKTAERLMVEFRGKIDISPATSAEPGFEPGRNPLAEAIRGLEALGYSLADADTAIRKAAKMAGDTATVEELIRLALKG